MRSRHSTSKTVCPSSSSGTVTTPDMTAALLSQHYDPSLNYPAPLSRQNRQPRRSEAEPHWIRTPDNGGSARVIHRLCSPVGRRPASPAKEPNQEPTQA